MVYCRGAQPFLHKGHIVFEASRAENIPGGLGVWNNPKHKGGLSPPPENVERLGPQKHVFTLQ